MFFWDASAQTGNARKGDPTQHLSDKDMLSLVVCLCELHNFCIDENEIAMLPNTEQDNTSTHQMDGGINAQTEKGAHDNKVDRIDQILDGCGHKSDVSRKEKMKHDLHMDLPRDSMLARVQALGWNDRPQERGTAKKK